MSAPLIVAALRRVRAALERRPGAGVQADSVALAVWEGGTRCVTGHPTGRQFRTDMPSELGGGDTAVTPGWLSRAALASCTATTIALAAVEQGIELNMLEIQAVSRSDTRGLLGMTAADGSAVSAAPHDCRLQVRIAARGIAADQLQALVKRCLQRSPIACALNETTPIDLHIEVQD